MFGTLKKLPFNFAPLKFTSILYMMTLSRIVLFMSIVVALIVAEKVTYPSKYDNINVTEIKGNRRLLLAYANCVLGKGKCSPEGKLLKENLKDAIETGCEKCTKAQEEGTKIIIQHLIQYELAIWREVCAKFDPEGKWRKVYEERARENGIIIPE